MYLTCDLAEEIFELYERVLDHYGLPTWWDLEPDLLLYYDPMDYVYGWHQLDTIGINLAICESWTDVVGTVIHEVWHHHQDPEKWEDGYEEEADAVVLRDLHLFLNPLVA